MLIYMSKRLQVLIPDDEYIILKKQAKNARTSLGEWVRSALRRISDSESLKSESDKIRALKIASKYCSPVDDVETMKRQITEGYLKE